jgi:hypothetical protein
LLRRTPSFAAAGVSLGLAAWYALESHGALLGLAERFAAAAPPLWLFAVVVTTRRNLATGQEVEIAHQLGPAVRGGSNGE